MNFSLPREVLKIIQELQKAGFKAYLVGGCVRDLILGLAPKDWDIATEAKPEEIQKLFPESVYENQFGTVGVKTDSEEPNLKVIEVTTFRLEREYTDKRHPAEVKFAKTIEEDLGRRDFTINAMALRPAVNTANFYSGHSEEFGESDCVLIEPYGGLEDLKNKIIRTVGKPEERFNEDALRLLRAVRFAVELDFEIDFNTRRAIEKLAGLLEMIAKERLRDELVKIIMARRAADGILLLEELDLLRYLLPELREGLGVGQNKHHIYTVFEHGIKSLDYAAKKGYSLEVRLASLLHDIGKPRTKRGEGINSTFYNHEAVGAKMTARALDNLRFPKEIIEKVVHLVRYHFFYYNVGEVTEAGVRRFLARVGPESVPDLIKVREADRIGSGVPKAVPYKIRHLLFMIEKVKSDPISPKMLKVNGEDVMKIAAIPPGPRVGNILAVLLEEVLDDPRKNTREILESRIKELGKLADKELKRLAEKAKERKEEFEGGIEEERKKKYGVS
jgi:poly(A) polymerase/tRNA nucleotidyltransferase (CCA-adding enzyme)